MEPLARGHFNNVINVFALLKKVKERRESTQVQGRSTDVQQVVVHPHQFSEDGSQILAARCEFNSKQFFNRMVP